MRPAPHALAAATLAAVAALGSPLAAQSPAVEAVSLMDLRFYDANGGFMADGLCLVFPPDGDASYELVVRDEGGAVKGKAQMQLQRWGQYEVFDGLDSLGVPVFQVGEPGDYVMSVEKDGEALTSLAFTMDKQESGDPFNPRTTFTREGPWQALAFLSSVTGKPDGPMQFHFWSCLREIPKDGSKLPQADVTLRRGDEVLARFQSKLSISGETWRRFNRNLVVAQDGPTVQFTMERLLSEDGEYTLVLESGGKDVKSWPLVVEGGALRPHPRSAFGYEPATDYLVPKLIDTSRGSDGSYVQNDVTWLESGDAGEG